MTAKKFVDKVSQNFKKLTEYINLSNTDFIRTTEERHKKLQFIFGEKLCDKKQIYLKVNMRVGIRLKMNHFIKKKSLNKRMTFLHQTEKKLIGLKRRVSF